MPLQIRRGTTSERLSITPLVSELIYDTTLKLVFVGDGTTAGGVAIDQDSSPNLPLGQISDVVLTDVDVGEIIKFDGENWINSEFSFNDLVGIEINTPEVNQVLKFNGTAWTNENEDSSLLVFALDDLSDVAVTDPVSNQFLKYDGANWVNSNVFDGDVTGSVFADNSTLLVDGVTGQIVGNVNNLLIRTQQVDISVEGFDRTPLSITTSTNGGNACNVNFFASRNSVANPTVLVAGDSIIDLNSSGWDGSQYTPTAAIKLGVDKYTTAIGTGIVPGRIVFLTFNESGTTGTSNAMIFNRFGNLGIGKDDPAQKLDVQGNGAFAGFVQFGRLTTTERNALSASNGMVIYNTTDNKFQGYQNSAWINLDDGSAA